MFFATIVGWPGMWRPIDILAGEGVRGRRRRRCEQCGRDHAGADCC
jgi:hypothetical protein